jgi:hypothetical protein
MKVDGFLYRQYDYIKTGTNYEQIIKILNGVFYWFGCLPLIWQLRTKTRKPLLCINIGSQNILLTTPHQIRG